VLATRPPKPPKPRSAGACGDSAKRPPADTAPINTPSPAAKRHRPNPLIAPPQSPTANTANIGKFISRDAKLFQKLGFERLVELRRGRGDLTDFSKITHKAKRLLQHLKTRGAPVPLATPPWSTDRCREALQRGPHRSAYQHQEFLQTEMAAMIEAAQWLLLPAELALQLPNLRVSPMGVVPQPSRRPRTIVDYTWAGINAETLDWHPQEAMQFGRALQRMLQDIVQADPRFGPVYLMKVDIADGFYRVAVNVHDIPKLGVAFPVQPGDEPLVALPLTLPMGWQSSPPYFCVPTETITDVANTRVLRHRHPGPHHLDTIADTAPIADVPPPGMDTAHAALPPPPSPPTPVPAVEIPSHRDPLLGDSTHKHCKLGKFDVFVDDFIGLAQGNRERLQRLRRILFHTIDDVFRPLDSDDLPGRQEPISIKKLRQGDGAWATRKLILGWMIDTVAMTLELPDRRRIRLQELLASLPPTLHRISVKRWQQVLGELRSMVPAIPGARGLFSQLQEALGHPDERKRIKLHQGAHDALEDFRWLATDLASRPTRLYELVPQTPTVVGTVDASGLGLGGVLFFGSQDDTTTASTAVVQNLGTVNTACNIAPVASAITCVTGACSPAPPPAHHASTHNDTAIPIASTRSSHDPVRASVSTAVKNIVWRTPLPQDIINNLISWTNTSGSVTNSDLELAASVLQHDVAVQNFDLRERTIHTCTDNTPTKYWQDKGSTSTRGPASYLLRLQALHQRFHRYIAQHDYLPGPLNVMADDASRLWHLSDTAFLAYFNATYPQTVSWELLQPTSPMHSAVISSLRKKRSVPASFLVAPKLQTTIGTAGHSSVSPSISTHPWKECLSPLTSYKSTHTDTALANLHPVVDRSSLAPWRTASAQWARRSPAWGPKTLV